MADQRISLQQRLLQKLSPQQIQVIKLLEIPAIQLEQRIKSELEENPILELIEGDETDKDDKQVDMPYSSGVSFHDSLIEQLGLSDLNEEERLIAEYIIGNIDEDGYL